MAERRIGADVKAILIFMAVVIHLALLIDEALTNVLAAFICFPLTFYVMFRVPVRLSMMALTFFGLALPNPADCTPADWKAPYHGLGAILLTHMNTLDRSMSWTSPIVFSGMDLCFICLFLVSWSRKTTRSRIDTEGGVPTPPIIMKLAMLSFAGTAFTWVWGIIRGGNFSMSLWQLNSVMYLPMVFFLYSSSLRGPKDHTALAKVLMVAGLYKAALAVYIRYNVPGWKDPLSDLPPEPLAYATSHADSILFATAFVLIVVAFLERVNKGKRWHSFVYLGIIAFGMLANKRRMAWVQVGLVMLFVYLVSRDSPVKKKFRRALLMLAPVAAVYARLGWNKQTGIFRPVAMLRSVVDTKTDNSSLWRDLENHNLILTFRSSPLFGAGYGHKYQEVIMMPPVPYSLEFYVPHNSILGLWAFTGYVGFTALTLFWAVALYYGMRAYHRSTDPQVRSAALVCFGCVLVYLVQCWGDLGLGTWTGVFVCATGLAVAGKLDPVVSMAEALRRDVQAEQSGNGHAASAAPARGPSRRPKRLIGSRNPSRT